MLSDKDYETETYIRFCKNDTWAYMYSADKPWITKMRRWASERPDEVKIKLDNKSGTEVEIPVGWVEINIPKKQRAKRIKKQ